MSCLVLPVPDHPSASSLRPTLTQSRKGKGNVCPWPLSGSAHLALPSPQLPFGSAVTAEQSSTCTGELPPSRTRTMRAGDTALARSCSVRGAAEQSCQGRMTSPGQHQSTALGLTQHPWVLLPAGG